MRLLLDTSVLVELTDGRLDPRVRAQLASPEAEVHVSVASLWEIAIKVGLGKLALGAPLHDLPDLIEATGLKLIAINASHVLAVADPEPATRDPFDRLLLAQCKVEGLQLVTIDRALITHPLAWRSA
jgi:PIN domain nuclease of toxin-antitoxin system